MKMINKASGEAVYFNPVTKAGKEVWVIQGIGSTVVIGRDRQKRKSRVFTQYHQAEAYLARRRVRFFHWKKEARLTSQRYFYTP